MEHRNGTIDFYIEQLKFSYLFYNSLDQSFESVKKRIVNDNDEFLKDFKKFESIKNKIEDKIKNNIEKDLINLKQAYSFLLKKGFYPKKVKKIKYDFYGMPAIYEIVNIKNNKRYIGKTEDILGRWGSHKTLLRVNKHHCKKLQKDYNKFGENAFRFNVIEIEKDPDELAYKERFWWEYAIGEKYNESQNMLADNIYQVKFLEKKIEVLEKRLRKYEGG
jgi:hypothetical protein